MKKIAILCMLLPLFAANSYADDHMSSGQGNGAFSTLFVAANELPWTVIDKMFYLISCFCCQLLVSLVSICIN